MEPQIRAKDETGGAAPRQIRLKRDRRSLVFIYDNGAKARFSAEILRVLSPSAEVQGHHPSQAKTVAGKRGVTIVSIGLVGHYALSIRFDDGHATGIYTWRFFVDLQASHRARARQYIADLKKAGLSRSP